MIKVKRKTESLHFFFNRSYSTPALCILMCLWLQHYTNLQKNESALLFHNANIPTQYLLLESKHHLFWGSKRLTPEINCTAFFFPLESLPKKKKVKVAALLRRWGRQGAPTHHANRNYSQWSCAKNITLSYVNSTYAQATFSSCKHH